MQVVPDKIQEGHKMVCVRACARIGVTYGGTWGTHTPHFLERGTVPPTFWAYDR